MAQPALDDPALYQGVTTDAERGERRALLGRLLDAGVDRETLRDAVDHGRLATLPVQVLLADRGTHTLTQVARESGIDSRYLRRALMALGQPSPAPRERAFSDQDVATARILRRFIDAGLPREELLQVGRVLSQAMATTAAAVRSLVGDALLKPGDSETALALRYEQAAEELGPLLVELLEHQLRFHVRNGLNHEAVTRAEREAGALDGTTEVGVAFADLEDFTRLGERLPAEDLGRIANRLSEIAADAVRPPVRLVKMMGDAAMLVSSDVDCLMKAIFTLVDGADAEGRDFPQLRAGVAWGAALGRGGDWFGAPVNLASRITDVAKPGHVITDETTREHAGDEGYRWTRKRRRSLKGVDGRRRLFRVRPA